MSDNGGAIAVLGFLAVYLGSTECLVLVGFVWRGEKWRKNQLPADLSPTKAFQPSFHLFYPDYPPHQFYGLAPFSAFIDLLRLGGPRELRARGWLIFFQLLGIAAKVCGPGFGGVWAGAAVAGVAVKHTASFRRCMRLDTRATPPTNHTTAP